jgi:hypothetical protein
MIAASVRRARFRATRMIATPVNDAGNAHQLGLGEHEHYRFVGADELDQQARQAAENQICAEYRDRAHPTSKRPYDRGYQQGSSGLIELCRMDRHVDRCHPIREGAGPGQDRGPAIGAITRQEAPYLADAIGQGEVCSNCPGNGTEP